MVDLVCRVCSEPYGCVGGLRVSHTDLTAWEFQQFTSLGGLGCPCCKGTLVDFTGREIELTEDEKADRTNAWARALQAASDETEPFPNFYDVIKQPWATGRWSEDAPSLLSQVQEQLKLTGLTMTPLCEEEIESGHVELWYTLDPEHFSEDEQDARRYSNWCWLANRIETADMREAHHGTQARVAVRFMDGSITICRPRRESGLPTVADVIYDAEKAVSDYPLLDEDKYHVIEAEQLEESWASAISEVERELSNLLDWRDDVIQPWLLAHRDQFFEQTYERCVGGHYETAVFHQKAETDVVLMEACKAVSLIGYRVHKSTLTEHCWLIRSVMEPGFDRLRGLVAQYRPQGAADGMVEVLDMAEDLPATEFGVSERGLCGSLPEVAFSTLPGLVKLEVIRWLRDPE